MCAIVAWNGQITNALLRQLFSNASQWGHDAVGLAYVDEGGLNVFKKAYTGRDGDATHQFLRNNNHRVERASRYQVGFGHTRWRTHGDNTDRNAHPFTHDGVTFAHNGIISNYDRILPSAVVDSECLGPLIKSRDTRPAIGSIGLVWVENNELYVYRRNQGLTALLCLNTDFTTTVIVVSRASILTRTRERYSTFLSVREHVLDEGVAYRVHSAGLEPVWEDAKASTVTTRDEVAPVAGYAGG